MDIKNYITSEKAIALFKKDIKRKLDLIETKKQELNKIFKYF